MKRKRIISLLSAIILSFSAAPLPVHAEEAEQSDPAASPVTVSAVSLNHIRSMQTFLMNDDLFDGNAVPDLDENGTVNAADLSIAKRMFRDANRLRNFSSDISDILLNQEEAVTFTVRTMQPEASVSLYDDTDTLVSEMYDDGTNGDETADDGIYSVQLKLKSEEIRNVDYYAAAENIKSKPHRICFYREYTEAEFDSYFDLLNSMSEIETYEDACAFLDRAEGIASYSADEVNQTIIYETDTHMSGFWQPVSAEEDVEGRGTYALPNTTFNADDYEAAEYRIQSLDFTPAHPDQKDIIAMLPYHNAAQNRLSSNTFADAASLLGKALQSNVTKLYDGAVSLEKMKNLSGYGVIMMNTHGGIWHDIQVIAIGEAFDRDSEADMEKYSADIAAERIYGTGDLHIVVTPAFFDNYYHAHDLDGTFWYFGSCHSMTQLRLASVLTDKGAECVAGFVNSVHTRFDQKVMFELMINNLLLSGETFSDSMKEVRRVYHRDIHLKDPDAYAESWGDPDYRLVSSVTRPRYKLFDEGYTWEDAKKLCEKYDGHLVTITSSAEQSEIEKLLQTGTRNCYWLGAKFGGITKKTMKWVTGEDFAYTKWAKGQPDYANEECLMIYRNNNPVLSFSTKNEWNNLANSGTYPGEPFFGLNNMGFICEWED